MKKYHDQKIEKREFVPADFMLREFIPSDFVFLFNQRLHLLLGKLKSKWTGLLRVVQLFSDRAVEHENQEGTRLKVKV